MATNSDPFGFLGAGLAQPGRRPAGQRYVAAATVTRIVEAAPSIAWARKFMGYYEGVWDERVVIVGPAQGRLGGSHIHPAQAARLHQVVDALWQSRQHRDDYIDNLVRRSWEKPERLVLEISHWLSEKRRTGCTPTHDEANDTLRVLVAMLDGRRPHEVPKAVSHPSACVCGGTIWTEDDERWCDKCNEPRPAR